MKALVFGGSGFLGSHVADALTSAGYEVTIFDKRDSVYRKKEQKLITGDIQNQAEVNECIKNADIVYHFAGTADILEAQNNPVETVKNNILSAAYILDACREYKIKRFVYSSSIYVYSDKGSFYRSSKQAVELLIENYSEIYGVDFTILRFGSLYGRRANEFNYIYNAIKQALTEGRIIRNGGGTEIRDYVNVLDAARASVKILENEYRNSYVMVTGTQTIRVSDLLLMIKEMLDNSIDVEFNDEKMVGHYEITPYSFKPRVAKKLILDYHYDLGQGILDCIYDTYKQLSKEGIETKFDLQQNNFHGRVIK